MLEIEVNSGPFVRGLNSIFIGQLARNRNGKNSAFYLSFFRPAVLYF